jgi:hypothetical protein
MQTKRNEPSSYHGIGPGYISESDENTPTDSTVCIIIAKKDNIIKPQATMEVLITRNVGQYQ